MAKLKLRGWGWLLWYGPVGLAAIAWAIIALLAPLDSATSYGLSVLQRNLIIMTFVLPISVVWMVAIYGVRRLRQYGQQIGPAADGKAMISLSTGLSWLVAALVIVQLVMAFQSYARHAGQMELFMHINIAVAAIAYLLAFVRIYIASNRLLQVSGGTSNGGAQVQLVPMIGFVLLATAYSYFVFHDVYRNSAPSSSTITSFYLSDPLILWLVVIPYVVQWLLGVLTAVNVRIHAITVPGIIYRQSLRRLANGVLAVVIFSIILQVLFALGPDLSSLGLQAILLLIYAIVILYGLGFVWIALGVKRMAKIEEAGR